MQIRLENIGIVKDSTLNLDGLTVITGKNNSGKTTVGKTLYALLDGVCDIRQKAARDRYSYTIKQLGNVRDNLDMLQYTYAVNRRYNLEHSQNFDIFKRYPALRDLIEENHRRGRMHREEIDDFAHRVREELSTFDTSLFVEMEKKFGRSFLRGTNREDDAEKQLIEQFVRQRDSAIIVLEKLFTQLEKDLDLVDYARESINQTMRIEFANQIQPVKGTEVESKVKLSSNDSTLFNLRIVDNNVVNEGTPVFNSSPYRNIYLIDDPFVLDDGNFYVGMGPGFDTSKMSSMDSLLNPGRINSHSNKLKMELRNIRRVNVFEQIAIKEAVARVKQQIDKVIPGAFEFTPEGDYYVQNGVKLKMSNLATGSKMFSLIKLLLERGKLDSTTMLILDEPEAHLHPQWQNAFAEMIVLLVKELDVNIVLTTHSPNFMLAIDAYMRKHEINDKTNFYQTEMLHDGFVQYQCVNDDLGKIYQDFLQYLSEVKVLRNKYAHGIED